MSVPINRINVLWVVNKLRSSYPADYAHLAEQIRKQLNKLNLPERYARDASNELICELFRFLYIKKHDNNVSPPYLIDVAWHELLLMPKFYGNVCGYIAREGADGVARMDDLIDHDPLGGTGNDARPRQARYERTLQKYREFFPNSVSIAFSLIWNEDLLNHVINLGAIPATAAVAVAAIDGSR